ncbi:MAG: ribosome small subunit-dependent GTPase A [Woeseiaceae bacterium]|nr:ribosome small subunit-dependent GTPase A [Woeseiaceae bacterium]
MPEDSALVIATYSRRMRLRLADGRELDARIKGKRLKPVCGDRVVAEPIAEESDWLITAIQDRRNALSRPNLRGETEILAANIDLLIVVAAASPQADWYVVDRYVCAAEDMNIPAAVVFNKADIGVSGTELSEYAKLGYATVECSAKEGSGLSELTGLMADKTAIIVGQSGVGKSSIINAILGYDAQRTAEISGKTREGRHTTVNSMMLRLPEGGTVIDSPGVRDFAPALQTAPEVIRGFREIEAAGHDCRFANCRHMREPGCAVKSAVEDGAISERRYQSYRRSLNMLPGRPA